MLISIRLVDLLSLRNLVTYTSYFIIYIYYILLYTSYFSILSYWYFSWVLPVITSAEYFEQHIPLLSILGIIWTMGEVPLPESLLEKYYKAVVSSLVHYQNHLGDSNTPIYVICNHQYFMHFLGLACNTFLLLSLFMFYWDI